MTERWKLKKVSIECQWMHVNIRIGNFCSSTSTAALIPNQLRHHWVLYNVKGCSCVTVLYVFLHGSTSAVVQIQASSLTRGHCLPVEADRDPRQLQSLRSVSLSLRRSVRDHNIHIMRVYSNNGDIWNAPSPSRCCSQSVCKKSFGRRDIEIMWNVVSICKQGDCSCSLDSWGILTSLLFLLWKCVFVFVCVCRVVSSFF